MCRRKSSIDHHRQNSNLQKQLSASSRVLVAHQEYLQFLADPHSPPPIALSDPPKNPTLKPISVQLTSPWTKRICSLAASASLTAWWLDLVTLDSRLVLPLVCGLAGGYYALLATPEEESNPEPEAEVEAELNAMWTITQFETLGALRFDNYLRFLITKLAVVWRTIATLHKTALNYKFTVSISDKPSLADLQDLLEGRVPLQLTYDDIRLDSDDETTKYTRSRGSSRASTEVTDDSTFRESMDLSGLDLCGSFVEIEKPAVMELEALEDQEQVTEYFTIEDDGSWPETGSESVVDEEGDSIPLSILNVETPQAEVKLTALRSILVPMLPLETLSQELHKLSHSAASSKDLQPLMVPSVKPLVEDAKQADWHAPAIRPEAAALLARAVKPMPTPMPKRRIAVNVASTKPLPRLVVKARPSTLTPPQNVQRMLDQVERMMQEVHDLLAAGRDVLRSVETPEEKATRQCTKKSVSFSDDVDVIDSALDLAPQEELELRTSLSYGPDEIEWMTNDFFADIDLPALSSDA